LAEEEVKGFNTEGTEVGTQRTRRVLGSGSRRLPLFEAQVNGRRPLNGENWDKLHTIGGSAESAGPCATIGLLACLAQKARFDDGTHP
jgi:hypothetical protein